MASSARDWNEHYATGHTPWDSGAPSAELIRVLGEWRIEPCRTLELGCGTGENAVYLARQGFDVTALDVAPLAIERAEAKVRAAGVQVKLLTADVLALPDLGPPFALVFDRGLYHAVRRDNLAGFLRALERVCTPGGWYLTLAGNDNDPAPPEQGPPRVRAEELCSELEPLFALVQLREFTFEGAPHEGTAFRPLAWSALLRRRTAT
jgi:SAM-dependent methyltransferase